MTVSPSAGVGLSNARSLATGARPLILGLGSEVYFCAYTGAPYINCDAINIPEVIFFLSNCISVI